MHSCIERNKCFISVQSWFCMLCVANIFVCFLIPLFQTDSDAMNHVCAIQWQNWVFIKLLYSFE